ncbi:uncharacterized protein LOC132038166 [Lycium ferocissimum]|uniref:uncharacterized protein LOC132038166 n=1 Tax=Lycium ferocissimum TaxID=112874 RepID=UPI0028158922|nr:uncharacterized protein LOC132038166 [Lycium ferocissimum]
MDLSGHVNGLGMELLNQSNYKIWKTCMESYLVGENLWDVVNGSYTSPPIDGPKNSSAYKKWKQINAKAEFILKRSISHNLVDHIIRCKLAHEIWRTFDRLFNKKDEARLEILENDLANTIQGWAQQPSLEEFEKLLSSQELLAKQMASVSIKEGEGNALVANKRNFKEIQERSGSRDMTHSQFHEGSSSSRQKEDSSNHYGKKYIKCYRCGKIEHIKRYCQNKESNMAQVEKAAEEEEEDWGRCFVAEA